MSVKLLMQTGVENQALALRCYSLICPNITTNTQPIAVETVNQASTIATTVVCGTTPSNFVIVNTQTATAAVGNVDFFTFQNSNITTTSIVKASILNYSNSFSFHGLPVVVVSDIIDGGCYIVICNPSSLQPLDGSLKIYVEIYQTTPYV